MKYDLNKRLDIDKFNRYCSQLVKSGAFVELKKITQRSNQQNRYLHLILSWFASSFGYTLEYTKKQFFKIDCNKAIFLIVRTNHVDNTKYKDLRSTSELTTAEMTTAIERFRNFSADNDLYLPEPNEMDYLKEIEIELEKTKQYL
jgi:hypothetical protein